MSGSLVDALTIPTAWLVAAQRVCEPGEPLSFLVVSAKAGFPAVHEDLRSLDDCARSVGAELPSSVAGVLFPQRVVDSAGPTDQRIKKGWELFGRGRRAGLKFSGWKHTYFERLTGHWIDAKTNLQEIKENRLASIIEKINAWDKDVEAAFYVHTEASTDRLRPRGAPCLQYVQFRLHEKTRLELFALYRSHDYFNKVLGNMIGLQRLGQFVADSTGREFIGQTVFSLHPFSSAPKKALREFAERVRSLPHI